LKVTIKDLSDENIDDHPCFKSGNERAVTMTKTWLTEVYTKFGPCVKVAYVNGKPVALVQYGPMDIFPHVDKPDAHETILIHCIYTVDEKYKGKGIARKLVESLVCDMKKPHRYLGGGRFKKIVALSGKKRLGPAGPVEFFRKVGFTEVRHVSEYDILVEKDLWPEEQ